MDYYTGILDKALQLLQSLWQDNEQGLATVIKV